VPVLANRISGSVALSSAHYVQTLTVEAMHPIARNHEEQPPHHQYSEVDDRTPQQKLARESDVHALLLRRSSEGALVSSDANVEGGTKPRQFDS
jgi:hypothetical protein